MTVPKYTPPAFRAPRRFQVASTITYLLDCLLIAGESTSRERIVTLRRASEQSCLAAVAKPEAAQLRLHQGCALQLAVVHPLKGTLQVIQF